MVVANDDGTLPGGLSEARLGELLASGDEALNAVASQGFEVAGGGQSAGAAASGTVSPMASRSYIAATYTWTSPQNGASLWG